MTNWLDSLKNRLDLYLAAEEAILGGAQSYNIGSRSLTRADIQFIQTMIPKLRKDILIEENRIAGKGRNKVFGIVPRDN